MKPTGWSCPVSVPRHILLGLLCCAFAYLGCDSAHPYEVESHALADGSGVTYDIRVGLPPAYDQAQTHTVIYVLDGDWYFDQVVSESAEATQGDDRPVVVGIGGGRGRTSDYTPTPTSQGDGNAAVFTDFFLERLMPFIEEHHAVGDSRNDRVVLGHSLGGLYAAYAFTKAREHFGAFLMLSPSVWYDGGVIFEYEEEHRAEHIELEADLFVSYGELEPTQLFMTLFHEQLRAHYPQAEVRLEKIPGRNHSTAAYPGIAQGIRFLVDTGHL